MAYNRTRTTKSVTLQTAADLLNVPYSVIRDAIDFGLLPSFRTGETQRYQRVYLEDVRPLEQNRERFLQDVDAGRLERQKAKARAKLNEAAKTPGGPTPEQIAVIEETAGEMMLEREFQGMRDRIRDLEGRLDQMENTLLDSINVLLTFARANDKRLSDLLEIVADTNIRQNFAVGKYGHPKAQEYATVLPKNREPPRLYAGDGIVKAGIAPRANGPTRTRTAEEVGAEVKSVMDIVREGLRRHGIETALPDAAPPAEDFNDEEGV